MSLFAYTLFLNYKKIRIFAKNNYMNNLKNIIENAWQNRDSLKENNVQNAIKEVIELLDNGQIRVAEQWF